MYFLTISLIFLEKLIGSSRIFADVSLDEKVLSNFGSHLDSFSRSGLDLPLGVLLLSEIFVSLYVSDRNACSVT